MTQQRGFSLIELLVVISIMGVLITFAVPNFLSARERARDTKLKRDINQLKHALRIYYNDFQRYPAASSGKIKGCGDGGTSVCPCTTANSSVDFAVGAVCDTVYMRQFPVGKEFGSTITYTASADGESYCIVTTLENASDGDIGISQTKCSAMCTTAGATYTATSYLACSY